MSHNVSFPFSPQLKESIQKAIHASSQLGSEESTKMKEYIISLHIENETFVLFKEYHCHTDVVVRELPVPVFFFCRDTEDPQQWGVVTYVSDTCPPKKKMICATCCQYLKKECGLTVVNEKRVFAEEDVHASLREVNEDARERAAARAERYAAALKQAEEDLAPRPMIGMGTSMNVTMKFSEDVLSELKALNETENPAGATLTLRINDQEAIVVDKTLGLIDGVNLPCYYLAYAPVHTSQGTGRDTTGCPAEEEHTDSDKNSGTETRGEPVTAYRQVCFYVLSSMAKPKERMRYASAKEQLLKELLARGCTFDKCKECASAEEVMELLHEGRAVENQWDFGKK